MIKKKKNAKLDKKIVFAITASPYRHECVVVCNGQFSDAMKFMSKNMNASGYGEIMKDVNSSKDEYLDDFKNGTGCGRLYTELSGIYVMLISHESSWIQTTGIVIHECLHLTHYILRRAGLTLIKDSEEAYTYLQQDLTEKILRKIY